jgi:hypothetical protein
MTNGILWEGGGGHFAVCLKNTVNFLVAKIYKKNFEGCFFLLRAFAYANVGHLEVNFRLHKNVNVFSWRVHMIGCGSTVLYATGQNPYSLPVVF